MGRIYNFSKYFLFFFSLFLSLYSISARTMESDESPLAKLKKGALGEHLIGATEGDIIIDEAGCPQWKMIEILPENNDTLRRNRNARTENTRRATLNASIAAHRVTKEKKRVYKSQLSKSEEENARLKEENQRLLERLRLGFRDEDVIIKVLQTQILELQAMLARQGFHVDINMDVLGGPSRDVSRGAVIAANPFISLVEHIQNSVQRQLKEAQQKSALLLTQLEARDKSLAAQIAENRRLKLERDDWEFKATQRLAQLEIAQQVLTEAEHAMEHKWIAAMQMQNKLIQDLATANHRLTRKEQENPDGMDMLDAISPSAQAIAHTVTTSPQLEKGKIKILAGKLAKKKETLKAERRKNVEMGRRVREFVLQLATLTRERDEQEALIKQQQTMIADLRQTIQGLEEDSERFAASNKELRRQLGEINELVPVPSSEPSSSSGPINVLDSLKERLALYMQNVEQKQVELRGLQEKDEQSQAVIQQWQAWFEDHLEELRQYEQKTEAEIEVLQAAVRERDVFLQQQATALEETEGDLVEAGEINDDLQADMELLIKERDALRELIDKWTQGMRTRLQPASDTDTDTSIGVVSAITVVERTADIDLEAAAAARAQREQKRLDFVEAVQRTEESLLAADEEYQVTCYQELSKREKTLRENEDRLRQRREDAERRRQELEETEEKFRAREKTLSELREHVDELDTALDIKTTRRMLVDTLRQNAALQQRLQELEMSGGSRMMDYVATSAFTPDTPAFFGERAQGGGQMSVMDLLSTTLTGNRETLSMSAITEEPRRSALLSSLSTSGYSSNTSTAASAATSALDFGDIKPEEQKSTPGSSSYPNDELILGEDGPLPPAKTTCPLIGHTRSAGTFGEDLAVGERL